MITRKQKELLTSHGQAISELVSDIYQGNAALCIEWWEVGKELSKASYQDGIRKGTISNENMVAISECLGLSTEIKKRGQVTGAVTINFARKFYREYPTEEKRDAVIAEYKTWSSIVQDAFYGNPPKSSAGSYARNRSKSQRGGKRKSDRLIPPHNAKILWEKAIQDFMASTGEDYATARKILFRVLSDIDYVQAMRESWKMYQEESAR